MVEGTGYALLISYPGMLAQGWLMEEANMYSLLLSLVVWGPKTLQKKSRLL